MNANSLKLAEYSKFVKSDANFLAPQGIDKRIRVSSKKCNAYTQSLLRAM